MSKIIVGVADVQFYSTKFASELCYWKSIEGLKISLTCRCAVQDAVDDRVGHFLVMVYEFTIK